MRCLRLAVAFLTAAAAVATLEAQPGAPPAPEITPIPLAVVLLDGIDDPAVVADLKLTDAQVKALVARRTALWDEAYTTAPTKFNAGNAARAKSTDELLKKVLSADQYKRAGQLAAQNELRDTRGRTINSERAFLPLSVSTAVLKRYPELADAFKLTDDQKKQLDRPLPSSKGVAGRGTAILMSKEQANAAKEFLGPVAKPWRAKRDPRIQRDSSTEAVAFGLLEAKDVRADLKLNAAQAKVINDLGDKRQKLTTDRQTVLSPKDAAARSAELTREAEKVVAVLTQEQAKRLKQIEFQTGASPFNTGSAGGGSGARARVYSGFHIEAAYTQRRVSAPLEFTDEQREQFRAVRLAFNADAAKVLAEAQSSDAAAKKLDELVVARRKRAEAVLTVAQAAKWQELVGAPFTGSIRSDRSSLPDDGNLTPVFGGPGGNPVLVVPATVRVLQSGIDLTDDLKLTDEQKQKLAAAAQLFRKAWRDALSAGGLGPNRDEYAAALRAASEAHERAVRETLTDPQKARVIQIDRQMKAAQNPFELLTSPDVVKMLGLTDQQFEKLKAIESDTRALDALRRAHLPSVADAPADLAPRMRDVAEERMRAVLTEAQRKMWREFTGAPLKGLRKTVPSARQ